MFETFWKHDGWNVGIINAPAVALLLPDQLPPIAWLNIPAKHSFFADPFLIERGGVSYCFFEELPYRTNRGVISYVRLDEDHGRPHAIYPAIAESHHLSYPFLLWYEGEILCIPEASQSGRIVAYAARAFPDQWYPKATLLDFPGVDPTIFRYGDYWWLLCTDGRKAWNSDLHAFYADNVYGPWHPHLRNPIVSDLGRARPGGTPFISDGKLYRPAQNCLQRYGGSLVVLEVLELAPDRYEERRVVELKPEPGGRYPDGLHTASAIANLVAVDGNRFRFEPDQARRVAFTKVRSVLSRFMK